LAYLVAVGAEAQMSMVRRSSTVRFRKGAPAAHVEACDLEWIKVLVAFNPADPAELRYAQTGPVRRLDDWVTGTRRRWLIELLVPPTPSGAPAASCIVLGPRAGE
jgi:myo-inositol catabolism protein IolC